RAPCSAQRQSDMSRTADQGREDRTSRNLRAFQLSTFPQRFVQPVDADVDKGQRACRAVRSSDATGNPFAASTYTARYAVGVDGVASLAANEPSAPSGT